VERGIHRSEHLHGAAALDAPRENRFFEAVLDGLAQHLGNRDADTPPGLMPALHPDREAG